jgi:hypothetical protein
MVTLVDVKRHPAKNASKGVIMSPAHARSLSITRMAFSKVGRAEYDHEEVASVFHIALDKDDADWLHYLVQHLGTAPQIRYLQVALGIPQLPLQRTAPAHRDTTFRVKFRSHFTT